MKKGIRILLGVGFMALLFIAWAVAVNAPTSTQTQAELIAQADLLIADEIYIRAMPILEEAAGYNGGKTLEAESMLKTVYLELMGQSGIRNKYVALLERQMNSDNATAEVFKEAANFYISINKLPDALNVLKSGIDRLHDQSLIDFYEAERYAFQLQRVAYADVTMIVNDRIQVYEDGFWGLANSDGTLVIPCTYDNISNYGNSRAIVLNKGEIYAIDNRNNRVAYLHENASDIGNYGNDRVSILTTDGWKRATGDFAIGSAVFEEIGMYTGGYAAAKQSGKWGVVNTGSGWLIPAEYDEIIMDELGRAYAQNAVFAKTGSSVILLVNGQQVGETFEDARPFGNEGYAAVKKNGQWGFINTNGEVMIPYKFEDALSFGQHLAAVRQGEFWGYIRLDGEIAIEPEFLGVKSFSNGSAPVLTERGWQFISLLEYMKGAGL